MRNLIVGLFTLTLLGCTDDNSDTFDKTHFKGTWVGVENETDTLYIETLFEDKQIINLKRDIRYRTGPYEYKVLADDKISIRWMLAATLTFDEYYFKVTGDKLSIENFYDSPSGAILTFKKID